MLTDTAVRNAKPKEKPYKLTDGKGLYLLVNQAGKYWRRITASAVSVKPSPWASILTLG